MAETFDVIVLGAGAAGMMAAAVAGQRGARVLLLEHADRPGKKILISGGGRCNFTNIHTAPDRYLSQNPHFVKSALGRYGPDDFLELVERYGIAWHEKTLGQLFCDGPSKQIVELLLSECEAGGVALRCGSSIDEVRQADGHFFVRSGEVHFQGRSLVIATGGPSIPKMGATGFAYDLARKFGLKIVQPRPALVPLTLKGDDALFRDLSGVATDVIAKAGKALFREAALFTHRGLSGPAILQVSSYWQSGTDVFIDFLPDAEEGWLRLVKQKRPKAHVRAVLGEHLPDRLATALAERLGLVRELANLSDKDLNVAEQRLAAWAFAPNGTEGFAKAEVTAGGVSTDELSSRTMEAKKLPGLYFIGEAVDVTGWLGGYNFQWAWASAQAAGQAIEF